MNTSTEKSTAKDSSTTNVVVPCVVCDRQIYIRMTDWALAKKPCGVCPSCRDDNSMSVIYQFYNLRSQFSEMKKRLDEVTASVEALRQDFDELTHGEYFE